MKLYEPTWASLRTHPLPKWYDDAKFGIFIHWGLYSVPAWAPTTGELGAVPEEEWFIKNPYAEWYLNSLRIKNSPTNEHHSQKYGKDFEYANFADLWKAEKWNPSEWADLFKKAGAKYVVPTTKHHEGFCLWPSKYNDFHVMNKGPERDIIGELSKAVREAGMKFGVYYSGALDWTFTKEPIEHSKDLIYIRPQTYQYADYAYNQFMELIDAYDPDILWNDIGWPQKGREDLKNLFAYFYNKNPGGLVNDRWDIDYWDFRTAEYQTNYPGDVPPYKWEFCRGLGFSFGYNQMEGPEHVMSMEKLVHTLTDVVSKRGNLLIDIGPKADGTVPEIQVERLLDIGKWLEENGEAIYGTRPWVRATSKTTDGLEIRFTKKDNFLYVIILGIPKTKEIVFDSLIVNKNSYITLLNTNEKLKYHQNGKNLSVTVPKIESDYTVILKISPIPEESSNLEAHAKEG